jgi:hypothetical protein
VAALAASDAFTMWVLTLLLWHNTNRWPIGCLQLYRLHIANAIALAAGSETQT